MKKILLILLLLPLFCFSQEIKKNEIDEFTGSTIKETSWEILSKKSSLYSYCRLRKVDGNYFLGLKIISPSKVIAVENKEVVFIKLSNNEIVKLTNLDYKISNYGNGAIGLVGSKALGLHLTCSISKEQIDEILKQDIYKIRIYTTDGYIESEVKSKQAKKVNDLFDLIIN